MKDAGFALQKAYFTLLGDLEDSDTIVPVYSIQAPDGAEKPYVILGQWVARSSNTKDSFYQSGEITLDVVTHFDGDAWSRQDAARIASLITELLMPQPTASTLEVEGFDVVLTQIQNTEDVDLETAYGKLVRKLITVTHILKQA